MRVSIHRSDRGSFLVNYLDREGDTLFIHLALPWNFDLPNGNFNDNLCLFLTNLMSKMKYIVPFLSNQPFIIPLVFPRKKLTGFSLPYLGLLREEHIDISPVYTKERLK